MSRSTFEEQLSKHGQLIYVSKGDSMRPLIQEHDLLVIKKTDTRLKRLDIPLYKRDNGQYVLHRILKVRKNDYVLCGDNRYGKEVGITDRHILGVLTQLIRDGETISLNSFKYRAYAHLWCDFFLVRAALLFLKFRVFKKRKPKKRKK